MNKKNWQSVVRYLSDGPKLKTPKSFEEGMKIWNGKLQPPDFSGKKRMEGIKRTSYLHWTVIGESAIKPNVISQLDFSRKILYVAIQKNVDKLLWLEKTSGNYHIDLLPIDAQKSMNIKLNLRPELDNFHSGDPCWNFVSGVQGCIQYNCAKYWVLW